MPGIDTTTRTPQEQLVVDCNVAADYAKGLRRFPLLTNDIERKNKIAAMRQCIHNQIKAFNAFAHSTGIVPETENWYLGHSE